MRTRKAGLRRSALTTELSGRRNLRDESAQGTICGREPPKRGSRLFLWGALVALCLLAANAGLVLGTEHAVWDGNAFFTGYQMLLGDFARQGELLLWNPWANAGEPSFAEPQVGALSPTNLLFALVFGGTELGFRAFWLASWVAGGIGILLFGRHLGAPNWGSFAVALGFIASGVYTGHAQHTAWIHSISILPFLIWRLDVALLERRWWPALEAGVLWGLTGLSGYPGLTILSGSFAGLWAFGRLLESDGRRTLPLRALLAPLVLCAVGCVVLSPTWLAFLVEGAGYSHRVAALAREYAIGSNPFPPQGFSTLATPYLSTLLIKNHVWGNVGTSNSTLYSGPWIPLLALAALAFRPRNLWRWFLLALSLLALTAAMGDHLPVRGFLYGYFPPTRSFRHSGMFRIYALFTWSALALLATRDLARSSAADKSNTRTRLAVLASVVSVAAVLGFAVGAATFETHAGQWNLALWHLAAAWGGVLAIALAARLRWRNAIAIGAPPLAILDTFLALKLSRPTVSRSMSIWDVVAERHVAETDLEQTGWQRLHHVELAGSRHTRGFATKEPALTTYAPFTNPFHEMGAAHAGITEMATGSQRVWFATEALQVAPANRYIRALKGHIDAEGGAPILLVHDGEQMRRASTDPDSRLASDFDVVLKIRELPAAVPMATELIEYKPTRLAFRVNSERAGWLLVTDRWTNGWRARCERRRGPGVGLKLRVSSCSAPRGPERGRVSLRALRAALATRHELGNDRPCRGRQRRRGRAKALLHGLSLGAPRPGLCGGACGEPAGLLRLLGDVALGLRQATIRSFEVAVLVGGKARVSELNKSTGRSVLLELDRDSYECSHRIARRIELE